MPPPRVKIQSVSPIGYVRFKFDQPVMLREVFENYTFKHKGGSNRRDLQQTENGDQAEVDISRFFYVTLVGEGNVNKED